MSQAPVIETERLILRKPVEDDFLQELEFWQSDRSKFVGGPMTRAQVWGGLAKALGHWEMRGYGGFSVIDKEDETHYGRVGPLYPESWPEPELGWYVLPNAEGKSIAYEAVSATRDWVYRDLGWETAISLVEPENIRSKNLALRLGARDSGEKFRYNEADVVLDIYRHPSPQELSKEALQ